MAEIIFEQTQSQLQAGDTIRKSLVEEFQSLQQKYQERCDKVEELKTTKACLIYVLEQMKTKVGCDCQVVNSSIIFSLGEKNLVTRVD